MSPCGVPEGWPALQNQRPNDPVRHLGRLLEARVANAGWFRRAVRAVYTWVLYRPWRATRRGVGMVIGHLTAAPVKTAVDVVTGLPVALLVWPPFREWVVKLPEATLVFLAIIFFRFIYTVYRRNSARQDKRQTVRKTQRIALAPIEMYTRRASTRSTGTRSGLIRFMLPSKRCSIR